MEIRNGLTCGFRRSQVAKRFLYCAGILDDGLNGENAYCKNAGGPMLGCNSHDQCKGVCPNEFLLLLHHRISKFIRVALVQMPGAILQHDVPIKKITPQEGVAGYHVLRELPNAETSQEINLTDVDVQGRKPRSGQGEENPSPAEGVALEK
ncbi:hypothetical protein NDU88_010165 [Pleurodeles waltl]|uniref:Uncharacterized protein n=1 Tax=Pleurodeles waltl TaxID=8319 RepID=A0AAV7Q157_PLEWA|nr:hypothetical protein NDU88_010165 [Pleurodeles waltl]